MKTITKKNVLKLATMVVATFMFTAAMGQTNNGAGVPGSDEVTFIERTEGVPFYMVQGTTIPLYAQPDPVYHPSWNYADGNWTLTEGFSWAWSRSGDEDADTGAGTVTFSPGASNTGDNYVEISIDQPGNYQIQVIEQAPVAFAGCEGEAQTLDIVVVAPPTATLGVLADVSQNFCVGDAGIPAAVNATISGGWHNYRLAWSLEIATLDGMLSPDEYFTDETGAGASGTPILAENFTESDPQEVPGAIEHSIITVSSFLAINNKPTRYTYTLTSINDQALRFGDYIGFLGNYGAPAAGDFTYNEINETFVVTIAPAPQTQPIFHIPGIWAE